MKKIKILNRLLLSLVLPFILSCTDDFLTKEPQGVVFDENLANPEGLESLLIGAYSHLDLFWGNNWIMGDVYSDDAYTGTELGDPVGDIIRELESYRQAAINDVIKQHWDAIYDGISRCNETIRIAQLALEKANITDQEYTQYVAEARFLRGYYHLEGIKLWDYIPYVDEREEYREGFVPNYPDTVLQNNEGNTPWGELGKSGYIPWQEVEEDFVFSSDKLAYPPRNVGRAHLHAALGLLGKTKLLQNKPR